MTVEKELESQNKEARDTLTNIYLEFEEIIKSWQITKKFSGFNNYKNPYSVCLQAIYEYEKKYIRQYESKLREIVTEINLRHPDNEVNITIKETELILNITFKEKDVTVDRNEDYDNFILDPKKMSNADIDTLLMNDFKKNLTDVYLKYAKKVCDIPEDLAVNIMIDSLLRVKEYKAYLVK